MLCLEEELRLLKTSPLHPPIYILNIFISTPAKKKEIEDGKNALYLQAGFFLILCINGTLVSFLTLEKQKSVQGNLLLREKQPLKLITTELFTLHKKSVLGTNAKHVANLQIDATQFYFSNIQTGMYF